MQDPGFSSQFSKVITFDDDGGGGGGKKEKAKEGGRPDATLAF